MYQEYYGLREAPFDLTPNPKFLFFTGRHREALSNLEYGLSTAKPVTLLIGEAGTGKTTLLRTALGSERCQHLRCLYLFNPTLTRGEFYESLARQFSLSTAAMESKATFLGELEPILKQARSRGEITALVIDEAQRLSDELLEEIRLLANLETTVEKLLPLVLAGQPELSSRLSEPGLRQLKQRIALRCEITPFEMQETAQDIASRIRTAGGDATRLFTREAVMLIHQSSHGIARTINVICDNALLAGFALGRQAIDSAIIREVVRDFDLRAVAATDHSDSSSTPAEAKPKASFENSDDPPEYDETSGAQQDGSDNRIFPLRTSRRH